MCLNHIIDLLLIIQKKGKPFTLPESHNLWPNTSKKMRVCLNCQPYGHAWSLYQTSQEIDERLIKNSVFALCLSFIIWIKVSLSPFIMSISGLSLIIEFSETGNWAFENDKMQVNLTGVGSIELTNQTSTVSSSYN